MRIEIFGEKKEAEKVLRLRLIPAINGVKLIAIDEFGYQAEKGNILKITTDGELVLYEDVSPNFGLSLDKYGKINIIEE